MICLLQANGRHHNEELFMKYWLLCLLLLLFPGSVMAACLSGSLLNVPATVTFQGGSGQYAVFDSAEYLQTVNFRVQGSPLISACNYFVTLSAGQSGNFSQRELRRSTFTLNYNAYTNASKSNILKALPTATSSETISGSFPALGGSNQTADHSFVWTIDPLQIVPASTTSYSDTNLTINLYSGTILNNTLLDTETITFQSRAESSVDLSLVDSSASFDINDTLQTVDFGTLETGKQRSFDIIVRSNDGYHVTMRSENLQQMIHEDAPGITSTINYTVKLASSAIDLTTGSAVEIATSTGTTPVSGTRFPIDFTISPLSGMEAGGNYSDVIVVEVTAQ
jgi:hypothetical protein